MIDLNVIEAFAKFQMPKQENAENDPVNNGESYSIALKVLAQSDEWLGNQRLVKRIFKRLEVFEPQGAEDRANMAAIYIKIVAPNGLRQPVELKTIQIKIADQETKTIPTKLLLAESPVFEEHFNNDSGHFIDLSGEASKEILTHFISYLSTGRTDFVTDKNAIELLLLAKRYKLTKLSKVCLEHLFAPVSSWEKLVDNERQMSKEESDLRQLLQLAKNSYISFSTSDLGDVAHTTLEKGIKDKHWNCLKQLHELFPITHLKLMDSEKNLDHLLAFVKQNPGLVSLDLGNSPNITDEYLEELSQYLPNLHSFSITHANIKAIPQAISDRVTALQCNNCDALTSINAPNATELDCSCCDSLTSINAPNATALDCSWCKALTSINMPNAIDLVCSDCKALISIEAPKARVLNCCNCPVLTSIKALNLIELYCRHCFALPSLETPNVTNLDCSWCKVLKSIVVPKATQLSCCNCDALTSIVAPCATSLICWTCRYLISIDAPNVIDLDFSCSPSFTLETRLKLFIIVRRNIILNSINPDKMKKKISSLALNSYNKDSYNLNDITDYDSFDRLLTRASDLVIPADFDSEKEKLKCEREVDDLLGMLIDALPQGIDLNWFKSDLTKINNLRQKMNRINWLASVLACRVAKGGPLDDPDAIPTLMAISNLTDAFVQKRATLALLSFYDEDASDQKERWKSAK